MTLALKVGCNTLSAWGAVMIFLLPLARKDKFWGRCLLFLGVFLAVGTLLNLLLEGGLSGLATVAVIYLLMVAMLRFCGKLRPKTAPYCAVWASMTFGLAWELHDLLRIVPGLPAVLTVLLPLALGFLLAGIMGHILPNGNHYEVGPRQLLSALLLWGLFAGLLQGMQQEPLIQNPQRWALLLICQLYVATILYLQNALFRKSALQQELDTMNLLWHQQKTQYNIAKANMDLINRKCHDLKHQVAALRAMDSSEAREPYLQEIETLVQTYDSIVKTGNEVLDTILTEKSGYAEAQNIRVNCVAQGEATAFIDPVDLYTMLGNTLDNAIEYVKGAAAPEQRIIDVLVRKKQRFLAITISNPLRSAPVFEEGLPVTTKAKNGYHGFGLKSVRHTAQKYGGYLTITTDGGIFTLRLLLPLPETEHNLT